MQRNAVRSILALVAAALLGGCSDAPVTVTKLPTFKKGGYIRFVNLGAVPIEGFVDDQDACHSLGFGEMAGPRLTALGEHTIRASAGGAEWSEKVRVESGQTLTVYAYGSKPEFALLEGDPITPAPGETLVRAANLSGSEAATITMQGAAAPRVLGDLAHGQGGDTVSVASGTYTFSASIGDKQVAPPVEQSLKADQSFTVLLASDRGKATLLVMLNNPIMIATAAGE